MFQDTLYSTGLQMSIASSQVPVPEGKGAFSCISISSTVVLVADKWYRKKLTFCYCFVSIHWHESVKMTMSVGRKAEMGNTKRIQTF